MVTVHHTNIYADTFGKSEFPALPTAPQQIFTAHTGLALTAVAFSPRCDYLVSAAKDQISRWDRTADNKWSANWSIKDKSGEINYAVTREAEMAAMAHFRSIEIIIYSIQFATFLTLALIISFPTTLLASIVYAILFIINK